MTDDSTHRRDTWRGYFRAHSWVFIYTYCSQRRGSRGDSRAYDKHVFRARRKKQGTEWLTDDYLRKVHADMFATI